MAVGGYAEPARASCLMSKGVYKCLERNSRTVRVTRARPPFPIIQLMLPSYLRSNSTVSACNGPGLQVKSDPGIGAIDLTQAAGVRSPHRDLGKFPDREISSSATGLVALIFPIGKFLSTRGRICCYLPDREIKMAKQVRNTADIGALVRSTRKAQNLRQDQLAGVSGVGLRFIVDLEAGKPTAQIGKVLQVLQTLGCSIDILAPGERRK